MADNRLVSIANHMLAEIVQRLTAAGIPVPTRRYIHAGEIAHDFAGGDCAEALVVSWGGSFQGQPGAESSGSPMKCAVPLSAGFTIALLRCVPTLNSHGDPPSADALQDAGVDILTDAMTLPAVIVDAQLDGELVPIGCSLVGLGDVSPIGPTGQVGGTVVNLLVSLV